jgi:hypothetical protein
MTRRCSALILLLAAGTLASAGCELQQKSTPVSPTATTTTTTSAPASSYIGTWASAAGVSSLSADKCGNFQWKISSQTTTTIAGDISATCGSLTINATGGATLTGQDVALKLKGTVSASGFSVCNFDLTGAGTIQGDTLPLAYSGTTCLGPVSGTETLKRGGSGGSGGPSVTFDSPKPVSPIDNLTVSGPQPVLTVANATRTGSPAAVAYRFQVAENEVFNLNAKEWLVPEGQAQTSLTVPVALATGTNYFWRAQAFEGDNTSPWSPLARFQTPVPKAPTPSGGVDDIDPRAITWLSPSTTDVGGWRITSTVTGVDQYGDTVCVNHTKAGQWPLVDVFRDGVTMIEGRILIVAQFNGRWYAGGFDWLRGGQTCKHVPANEYGMDQVRVSPMDASWPGPRPGDRVGYLVTALSSDRIPERTVDERSNIVMITYR